MTLSRKKILIRNLRSYKNILASSSAEIVESIYKTTRCHNSLEHSMNLHRNENLKYIIMLSMYVMKVK
jgi:hypothetical protein